MTLRVSLVSPTFGAYGGIEAFVLTLGAGLRGCPGIEARVQFKPVAAFQLQPELAEAAARAGGAEFLPRGSRALWRALRWADVVHVQHPSPDVFLGARLLGRPLLASFHTARVPGHSLRQRLWDGCRRRADRRFYCSEYVRRTWEGGAVGPESRVVRPFSELSGHPHDPAGRRGFVFVGRWIPGKGVDTLVEAYAAAGLDPARWPLLLVGDGPLRPKIEERVGQLKLSGVALAGFRLGEDKVRAIDGARFMVVPSNCREGYPLVAVEARHLGVPCIATRDGGLPEAAGAEALLCDPGDTAGLAARLREAAAMPDAEYAARSERTRATLLPTLFPPASYADVYRELAGRARPPGAPGTTSGS